MTTIAWDGETVAADKLALNGDYRAPKAVTKIRRIDDCVYACAGTLAPFEVMIKWHQNGAKPGECPQLSEDNSCDLFVFKDGRCMVYRNDLPFPDEIFAPNAFGTGKYFAIGAMKAGKSAADAVKIASECDIYTGNGVIVEFVGGPMKEVKAKAAASAAAKAKAMGGVKSTSKHLGYARGGDVEMPPKSYPGNTPPDARLVSRKKTAPLIPQEEPYHTREDIDPLKGRGNAGSGYAKGGNVHSDTAEDKALIRKTVRPEALKAKGGKVKK